MHGLLNLQTVSPLSLNKLKNARTTPWTFKTCKPQDKQPKPKAMSNISSSDNMSVLKDFVDAITRDNTIIIIVFMAMIVNAVFTTLIKIPFKLSERKYYPQYLPSPSSNYPNDKANRAGYLQTIMAISGTQWPHVICKMMKKLPANQRWVGRLNMPIAKPCTMGFLVCDAEIARDILKDKRSIKPVGFYGDFDFVTDGYKSIFTANGIRWKHSRKSIAPAFSPNHIKRINRICAEKLDTWIKDTLKPLAESGKSFDASSEMINLTLSIICDAAFDYQMPKEERDAFLSNLEVALKEFVFFNPLHKSFPLLFPEVWKAKRAARKLMGISMNILNNYRRENSSKPDSPQKKRNYKDDTIIFRILNNPEYVNDQERAADILFLLLAGHDTTAYTISWVLLEIARTQPPELMAYRKQITELERGDWTRIDELHYMIKEGMRLHRVAPGSIRQTGIDFEFNDEFLGRKVTIPAYSAVLSSFHGMSRNPEYFDDPDEFLPSRWAALSSDDDRINKMELANVAFSLGHRNCVGQSLANAEIQTVLATLLANYDFTVEDEGFDEFFLTLKPLGVKLVPRKVSRGGQ